MAKRKEEWRSKVLLCNDSFLKTHCGTRCLLHNKTVNSIGGRKVSYCLLSPFSWLIFFSLSSAVIQCVVVVFIVSSLLLFISARIQRLLFFSALLLPQLLLLLLPSKKLNWGKQSYSFSYWHSVRAFCTAQR